MKNAERSNCHFAVQQASDGEPVLVVQLYRDRECQSRAVESGYAVARLWYRSELGTPFGKTEACLSLLVWAAQAKYSSPCSLTSK
jgi:hypothetical protein